MNAYKMQRDRQQKEFEAFPIMFAFTDEQFERGMRKLGLNPDDTDKVFSVRGNGFIRKTDSDAFQEMIRKHIKEDKEAIAADETGEGYIYDMFLYELENHEYGYTYDIGPALDALGYMREEIIADQRLLHGFKKAIWDIKNEE